MSNPKIYDDIGEDFTEEDLKIIQEVHESMPKRTSEQSKAIMEDLIQSENEMRLLRPDLIKKYNL